MKVSQIIGLAFLSLFLVACGQQDPEEQAPKEAKTEALSSEDLLTQRAEDRWQALIAWDMKRAYEYLSPGIRQSTPLVVYAKRKTVVPMQYLDAVVKSTQCEQEVCTLKMDVSYIYQGSVAGMQGQEMTSTVTEKWIFTDDSWFYVED